MKIYRTVAGGYVREGDPEAAFLAFGDGDVAPESVLESIGAGTAKHVEGKKADRPVNKSHKPKENK